MYTRLMYERADKADIIFITLRKCKLVLCPTRTAHKPSSLCELDEMLRISVSHFRGLLVNLHDLGGRDFVQFSPTDFASEVDEFAPRTSEEPLCLQGDRDGEEDLYR